MRPVSRVFFRALLAVGIAAAWASPAAAQKWRLQYQYDELKSSLVLFDVQFSSAPRGVAVGIIREGSELRGTPHEKPVALVTSDGGGNWQTIPLKERPYSIFLLNDNAGWMPTEKGLWRTSEGGKQWTKLPKPPGRIMRVYFQDENKGWAACAGKKVLETEDGGQHWKAVPAATEQPGNADYTVFGWIAFANPELGIITGWNLPPHFNRFAPWLDPQSVVDRRETPHLSLSLQTTDAGKTWKSSASSMFGEITRVRFGPPGLALGLVEHSEGFQYASEVYRLLWPTGKSELTYRNKDFFVTDVWVTPKGTCYLAGVQTSTRLRTVVPQKVRVLKSEDLKSWSMMPVDYRAVATRVYFTGQGEQDFWLATDNGMILKLEK